MMHQHTDTTQQYIHGLLKILSTQNENEEYWFPTPEDSRNPTKHTAIHKLELLNPQENEESRKNS